MPSGGRGVLRSRVTGLLCAASLAGGLPLTPRSLLHRIPFRNFRRCNETPLRASPLPGLTEHFVGRLPAHVVCVANVTCQAASSTRHCRRCEPNTDMATTTLRHGHTDTEMHIPRRPPEPTPPRTWVPLRDAVLFAPALIHARLLTRHLASAKTRKCPHITTRRQAGRVLLKPLLFLPLLLGGAGRGCEERWVERVAMGCTKPTYSPVGCF